MASSPNQIVTSPRLRSPCSYSDQFLTEYFVLYFVYETGRACCHWIGSYESYRLTDSLDRHILGVKRDSCTDAP